MDRALYLPESWADDPDRRAAAGVPEDVEFATKPELAAKMITDALDAGVPAGWATGDEVYGADPALRHGVAGPTAGLRVGHRLQPHRHHRGRGRCAPTRWPRRCPSGGGGGCRRDRAARASATTRGRWLSSPKLTPASIICSCAATTRPANSPITAATARIPCSSPITSESPDGAGRWRNRSSPARA